MSQVSLGLENAQSLKTHAWLKDDPLEYYSKRAVSKKHIKGSYGRDFRNSVPLAHKSGLLKDLC